MRDGGHVRVRTQALPSRASASSRSPEGARQPRATRRMSAIALGARHCSFARKATFWRCDRGFRFHPKAEARQDGRATARRVSSRMESAAATPSSSRPHRCGACVPTITVARLRSHLARSPPGPTRPEGGGLDRITLHRCRRTFASLIIAAGVNAKALQTYMGHASISITLDRYGRLMPGSAAEPAGLLDTYLAVE
jgi:Phage integrase family